MHLRISRTTRNGKTYEYAQLVESVRRPDDGMPAHRVIATLGALSLLELDNLRTALRASREHKRVVVAPASGARVATPDVLANLRYLDLAVGLSLFRQWALPSLLEELLPRGEQEVPPVDVVTALVLQRLVDPDSKLAATEWFPRTSLPELLDVSPARFNNTRVHRVLEALDHKTSDLMARLPRRYQDQEGPLTVLFLDVSDAAFVGHGPSIAQKAKTKEGFVARKIGIVLLCTHRGYPLRWQVVPGAAHDSKTMFELLESIAGLRWVGEAPIVCDRAMGKTATVMALLPLGLRFLTALTRTEFESYAGERVPWNVLDDLCPTSSSDAKGEAEAVRRVTAAGFWAVDDNLFVLDLGLLERPNENAAAIAPPKASATPAQAMAFCRRMCELVTSQECPSFEEARRQLHLGKSVATKYRRLQRLAQDVQREVLAGRADACSLDELLRLGRLPAEQQPERFQKLVAAAKTPRRTRAPGGAAPWADAPTETSPASPTVKLRVVAYFNQERFVSHRYRAQVLLGELREFADDLNRRLSATGRRRSRASIEAEIDRKLRSHDLVECFTVRVHEPEEGGRTSYHVEMDLDEKEWAHRRRHDGFSLLVAHPELPHTAAQLCRLYRAKDAVEKDFRVIKSVVEVRPVYHHDDAKVRAHVTLCMLALLLERTLAARLRGHCSAEVALTRLEPCRLNQFANTNRVYALTRTTNEQREILRQLGLLRLVDDEQVAEVIRPR